MLLVIYWNRTLLMYKHKVALALCESCEFLVLQDMETLDHYTQPIPNPTQKAY